MSASTARCSSTVPASSPGVPVENLRSIEVKPPKLGRLNLKFSYQAGLNNVKTGAWVEEQHAEELDELVAAVQGAIAA